MEALSFRMGDHEKTVKAWWQAWHGIDVNPRLLSRFGVAVRDSDGSLLAVAHLYPAQCADLVMVGFTVRDPSLSGFKAGKALKLLMSQAEREVAALGYTVIYTAFDSPALQKLCKRRGYFEGAAVKEYFKEVSR